MPKPMPDHKPNPKAELEKQVETLAKQVEALSAHGEAASSEQDARMERALELLEAGGSYMRRGSVMVMVRDKGRGYLLT